MTREEAIWHAKHVFNIVIERCINAQNLNEAREFDEAKQIVIEALEQEETLQNLTKPNKSCEDDLISRQVAIDALAKEMPSLTTPDGCGEFDHDIQITDEAFVDCMQIINGLPSAQPFTAKQIQIMQELEFAQVEKAYELGKADRPTGHWIVKKGGLFESDFGICSICGNYLTFSGVNAGRGDANFCPNCGCAMKGGEEE